ncbi:MAG: fumarylacetoacetate hydrolase family protein [Deltaproteobacteria bacterium]|nr:fumarylacetoacetate hydrolase family protein [Deltaproteobacteria bacterium]
MKLVSFEISTPIGKVRRIGALIDANENGRIVDLSSAYGAYLKSETDEPTPQELAALRTPPGMIGWLRGAHKSKEAARQALEYTSQILKGEADPRGLKGEKIVYSRSEVRLLAPLPRPRSIRDFSIYEEHMSIAHKAPKKPAWYRWPPYYKGNPDSVVGPEDPIPYPYYTQRLDLEIEIAIVIGKEGRNLSFEQAKKHIAGYTILIDCSARDGYEREPYGPTKRKDFCNVLGPCLVTADEIDEASLDVRVSVDGETWFEGNTGHRRSFLAHHLVAYASDNETVYPGDILGTGTVGLGCSMDLGRWINVGQRVTFDVQGIGQLSHRIVEGERVVDYTLKGMDGLLKPPD